MSFVYMLMALTVALSFTTVSFQNKGYLGVKFLLKALASFSFLAMGLVALAVIPQIEKWHICILVALLFGLMGDLFLNIRGIAKPEYVESMLLAGMLFFLLGHVIYIIVFLSLAHGLTVWLTALLIIVPAIVFAMMKLGVISPPKARVPMLVYAFIIGGMLLSALNYIIIKGFGRQSAVILVGAVLFSVSDLMLSVYNFGKLEKDSLKGHVVAFIYLPTYYLAQTLFVLAMVL